MGCHLVVWTCVAVFQVEYQDGHPWHRLEFESQPWRGQPDLEFGSSVGQRDTLDTFGWPLCSLQSSYYVWTAQLFPVQRKLYDCSSLCSKEKPPFQGCSLLQITEILEWKPKLTHPGSNHAPRKIQIIGTSCLPGWRCRDSSICSYPTHSPISHLQNLLFSASSLLDPKRPLGYIYIVTNSNVYSWQL